MTTHFPISFDPAYVPVSSALGLPPSSSEVEVSDTAVSVRMGWAFKATFDRRQVASTTLGERVWLTRGVHGWRGKWLVNGAGAGIVAVHLEPPARARVLGFPVRLRELRVSVDDPTALRAALTEG